MLEIEPTAWSAWLYGNEVIADAATETFASWLHHRMVAR